MGGGRLKGHPKCGGRGVEEGPQYRGRGVQEAIKNKNHRF